MKILPNNFKPSVPQLKYLEAVLDPDVPNEKVLLAKAAGLKGSTIHAWHQDTEFQTWFEIEVDRRLRIEVAGVWQEILNIAKGPGDPRTRLDAARTFLARFDGGMRQASVFLEKSRPHRKSIASS